MGRQTAERLVSTESRGWLALKLTKDLHGLTGQRYDVLFAHLHALGRDTPFGFFEIDLQPLRLFCGPRVTLVYLAFAFLELLP